MAVKLSEYGKPLPPLRVPQKEDLCEIDVSCKYYVTTKLHDTIRTVCYTVETSDISVRA